MFAIAISGNISTFLKHRGDPHYKYVPEFRKGKWEAFGCHVARSTSVIIMVPCVLSQVMLARISDISWYYSFVLYNVTHHIATIWGKKDGIVKDRLTYSFLCRP